MTDHAPGRRDRARAFVDRSIARLFRLAAGRPDPVVGPSFRVSSTDCQFV